MNEDDSSNDSSPHAGPSDEQEFRLAQLRESYREVLDATKHQDDKIGRFIAGIAFLTAAALVFLQQPGVLEGRYRLGAVNLPLPALFLAAFLSAITLSLLLYLLATSAPLTIPGSSPTTRSRSFFLLIAGESDRSWQQLWSVPDGQLYRELTDELQQEILNIAQRADAKYRHSAEGSALFVIALMFFLLSGLVTVHMLALGSPRTAEWSLAIRAGVGGVLAAMVFLLYYQRYVTAKFVAKVVTAGETAPRWRLLGRQPLARALGLLMVVHPALIGILVVPGTGHAVERTTIGLLGSLTAAGLGVAILRPRGGGDRRLCDAERRRLPAAITVLGAALIGFVVVPVVWHQPPWPLAVALLSAVSPLAPNVLTTWRDRRERLRRLPELSGGPT